MPQVRWWQGLQNFLQQDDDVGEFVVHGHLVIMANLWWSGTGSQPYIVVLNGVSGPATFALTHVLTGGMTKDFVAYSKSFDPSARSEQILSTLVRQLTDPKPIDHITMSGSAQAPTRWFTRRTGVAS